MINISFVFFICDVFVIWLLSRIIMNKKIDKIEFVWEIALLLFYLNFVLVAYMTLFPFNISKFNLMYHRAINLVPFVNDFRLIINSDYIGFFKNVIANILLLVPFGFIVPFLFKKANKIRNILVISVIFSAIIEFCQYFISNRYTDINDLIFNVLGAVSGLLFFRITKKYVSKFGMINDYFKKEDNESVNTCIIFPVLIISIVLVLSVLFFGILRRLI